jgi:hypothetical protein
MNLGCEAVSNIGTLGGDSSPWKPQQLGEEFQMHSTKNQVFRSCRRASRVWRRQRPVMAPARRSRKNCDHYCSGRTGTVSEWLRFLSTTVPGCRMNTIEDYRNRAYLRFSRLVSRASYLYFRHLDERKCSRHSGISLLLSQQRPIQKSQHTVTSQQRAHDNVDLRKRPAQTQYD